MKNLPLTFVVVFLSLCLGLSACGKKSDPVLRDSSGKVIQGNSFPPPYREQITE